MTTELIKQEEINKIKTEVKDKNIVNSVKQEYSRILNEKGEIKAKAYLEELLQAQPKYKGQPAYKIKEAFETKQPPKTPKSEAKPKEVYHYTDQENFGGFENRPTGIWLTDNPVGYSRRGRSTNKITSTIDVNNLKLATEKEFNFSSTGETPAKIEALKKQGFDGVKVRSDGENHYLIFDKKNIKVETPKSGEKPFDNIRKEAPRGLDAVEITYADGKTNRIPIKDLDTIPANLEIKSVKYGSYTKGGKFVSEIGDLNKAHKNVRAKYKTNVMPDVSLIKDLTVIGANKLAKLTAEGVGKATRFADWSKEMVKDFGQKIKPHLLKIWAGIKKEFGKKIAQIVESKFNPARPLKMTDADFFKLDSEAPKEAPKVVPRTALDKLVEGVKTAADSRTKTEFLRSIERSKRYGKLQSAFKRGEGIGALFSALKSQKGEMPKGEFDPVKLSGKEQTSLFNQIRDHNFPSQYNTLGAMVGLSKILGRHKDFKSGGVIPTPVELGLLREVFGKELTDALMKKRTNWEKVKANLLEIINIPRVLMTFLDLSATFRQGLVLTVNYPKTSIPSIGWSFKYLFSEKAVKELEHKIATKKNWDLYNKHKLEITKREGGGFDITKAEEEFMGAHFLEKIPGLGHAIKGSQRAYVGFLNEMRTSVFDQLVDSYSRQGYKPRYTKSEIAKAIDNPKLQKKIIADNKVYDGLANYMNMASGRGSLGKTGNKIAPALNAIFFSPRNVAAKLQLINPAMYVKMPKIVRKTIMKDMLTMMAANTTILALASQIAGVTVETDPRSSDVGKIKIGGTRLDPWGGFQQVFRYLSQIISGQRKSTRTGKITEIDSDVFPFDNELDVAAGFVKSKFSPQIGILSEIVTGQDYFGRPLELDRTLMEKITPLYLQDAIDAAKELGWGSVPMAIPGFFGIGLQTYQPTDGKGFKKKKTKKKKKK